MALPEITAFCRVLGRSNPSDAAEQSRNLARLQELQSYLEPYAHPGINAALEAAAAMIELLASKGVPDRDRILETACRMLAAVEKHWTGPDPHALLAGRLAEGGVRGIARTERAPLAPRSATMILRSGELRAGEASDEDTIQRMLEELKGIPRINEMVLGELLIELGHVTRDEIRHCLEVQSDTGNLLGRILVEEQIVSEKLVEDTARLQRQLRSTTMSVPESAAAEPHGQRVERPAQEEARPELRLNYAGTAGKAAAASPRNRPAVDEETLLGRIMVNKSMIEAEDLARALTVQRASGVRIGEALVEVGATDWDGVERAVELQGRLRRAAGLLPRSA